MVEVGKFHRAFECHATGHHRICKLAVNIQDKHGILYSGKLSYVIPSKNKGEEPFLVLSSMT